MRRLLLILLLFISITSYSQLTPIPVYRIQNATTTFGIPIPAYTTIYDYNTGNLYRANTNIASTATITTASVSLDELLTIESDPLYSAWDKSTGITITESQISDLDHFTGADITGSETAFTGWDKNVSDDFSGDYNDLINKPTIPSGNTVIDWTLANQGTIHTTNYVDNDTQLGDGDIAAFGYIKDGNTNWDNSYGFITGYTETDPIFIAHTVSSIIDGTGLLKNDGLGNWSYDNSTYLTSYTETDPIYTNDPAFSISTSDITNLGNLSGTNTGDQDLSGLVPYSGATGSVNLGANNILLTGRVILNDTYKGVLIQEVSGELLDYGVNYFQSGYSNGAHPGAFFRIDTRSAQLSTEMFNIKYQADPSSSSGELTVFKLGSQGNLVVTGSLEGTSVAITGGSSNEFLMADGSTNSDTYLTSYTETDPIYSAWDKDYNDLINTPTITDDQNASEVPITDLGAYYTGTDVEAALQEIGASIASGGDGWGSDVVNSDVSLSGDGTPGNPLSVVDTQITITESQISDLGNYLTSYTETDPIFTAHTIYDVINGTGLLRNDGVGNWSYDNSTYLTGNQTISLSGDASGSGTTSISVTVADDSHNHIIGNVDGLQTSLDNKVDENAPITGATYTKITYDSKGLVTGGSNLVATDIPTLTASKISDFDTEVSNNTDVAANTAKVTNATHTGEATGSTALTIADNVIDYGNVDETLKQEVTDNDGSFNMNGSGIVNCSISTNTTFSFSNINATRSIAIELTVSSSATVSWNTTPKSIQGDAIDGDGTYLIHVFSWGTTEGDLQVTVTAL